MNRLEKLMEMERAQPADAFLKFAIALEYQTSDKSESIRLLELLVRDFPSYVPSYYQLGKMLQETNNTSRALEVYLLGIKQAEQAGDRKTVRELNEALNLLLDE